MFLYIDLYCIGSPSVEFCFHALCLHLHTMYMETVQSNVLLDPRNRRTKEGERLEKYQIAKTTALFAKLNFEIYK